ncbi:MAG TPA: hypothetical protein VND64_21615 [Pirellulales bacterium]|nr:hypothetical protein [Pirellulales bacterium]
MHDDRILAQIAYRPRRWLMAILLALVCAGEGLFCYFAVTNDRPGDVLGFRLSAHGMRIAFGILAGLGTVGLVAMTANLVISFKQPRRIVLTAKSVILPKPDRLGISREEIEIPFRELLAVEAITSGSLLARLRGVCLIWHGGKAVLMEVMFPSTREFDRTVALLQSAFAELGAPVPLPDDETTA